MTGKKLLLISSLNCILLFLVLSCQTKQEQNTTALPSSSDTVMHSAAPDTATPPVLDTISIFEQILKNKRSSYHYKNDTIEIKYGHIINKKQNHLFIKLKNVVEYRQEFRIYLLLNNKFKLIFYNLQSINSYSGYDLFDVNNDSYKDFLIAWHPANKSGQDYQDVYLYKKNKNEFSNSTSFCYSVFYPELKIVRGMFPGPVFFTFRWNKNYSVDTIEYIYGPYVCSPCIDSVHLHKVDYTKNKKITLLDEMPDYYDDDERDSIQQARFTY